MPRVVSFGNQSNETDIFDSLRREEAVRRASAQSNYDKSRYYDYLMGAPERDEGKYERAKEDSREEFRLGLKTKAIVESINNRQHQNDFNALTGLLGVSNAKMSRANAVLESKLGYQLATDVQLDSQAIRATIAAWKEQNLELAADPKELASFTAALNEFASAQSSSTRILHNLKGVGGIRFDQSGKLLGIVPITTLKDFYVSEFGVDPITNIAIPKADKVAAPNEKDVEAAAKDVEETESVLTEAGALGSVAEDKPVSDEWIKVAADWVAGTRQEVPQSELPGGTDQSGVYNPEEGEVTSRPLTRLEMLEMHGIAPREPQHTLLGRPLHPAGPDSFRAPEFLPSLEPSNLPEELTLDQRLNPQNYPSLNRDTSAGPMYNSEFYSPTGEEISNTVLPEYLSGGYEGYEMGDGHMSGSISPEEMPTETPMPPLPPNLQYGSGASPDFLPTEPNPDYIDPAEEARDQRLQEIQQETNQGLMQLEQEHNERLKGYMDEMSLRHSIIANTEKYANWAGLLGGLYGAGKWALTKGGPMALNYLRAAPSAADDIGAMQAQRHLLRNRAGYSQRFGSGAPSPNVPDALQHGTATRGVHGRFVLRPGMERVNPMMNAPTPASIPRP